MIQSILGGARRDAIRTFEVFMQTPVIDLLGPAEFDLPKDVGIFGHSDHLDLKAAITPRSDLSFNY